MGREPSPLLTAKSEEPIPTYALGGATAADMRTFEYEHRRRPMYPFEEIG